MHFIDFELNFFKNKLEEYEKISSTPSNEALHEAQVLHKVLHDMLDQGYVYTFNKFVNELDANNRLEQFILKNGAKPFLLEAPAKYDKLVYSDKLVELDDYLASLLKECEGEASKPNETEMDIYQNILDYSKWIFDDISDDTACIFLLRDTLLPYLAFKKWNKNPSVKLYPLIIGRRYLATFPKDSGNNTNLANNYLYGDNDEAYEMLYDALYTGLSEQPKTFNEFAKTTSDYIQNELNEFTQLKNMTEALLGEIKQKKIVVIESGMRGSMPMFLKSIDNRVDIRMFTTLPQFYSAYADKYYTKRYEKNRIFETLACQDLLFKFDSVKEGKFFVKEITDPKIKEKAIKELKQWQALI